MTVSQLKAALEQAERNGNGEVPVLMANQSTGTLLEVLNCGTIEAWPEDNRLVKGEFRGAGQNPDPQNPQGRQDRHPCGRNAPVH